MTRFMTLIGLDIALVIALVIALSACTDLPDHDDPRETDDPPSCDSLLANGSFDSSGSWVAQPTDVIYDDSMLPPEIQADSGSYFAWLGGATSATRSITQQIVIPVSVQTLVLEARAFVATESTATRAEDTLSIQLLDSAGSVLATAKMLSNLDATDPDSTFVVWDDFRVTFTRPAGTGALRLISTNDAANNTNFFFDTMSLVPAGCP